MLLCCPARGHMPRICPLPQQPPADAPQARTVTYASGSSLPFLLSTEGDTDRPPVLRPMRSVSSTKLSLAVPIWVRHLRPRCAR
jgi:hypothetical protein